MSIDMPAAFDDEAVKIASATEAPSKPTAWVETALTVLFAASAVLFASFVAVVTGIV
jgi:hypothetical protein